MFHVNCIGLCSSPIPFYYVVPELFIFCHGNNLVQIDLVNAFRSAFSLIFKYISKNFCNFIFVVFFWVVQKLSLIFYWYLLIFCRVIFWKFFSNPFIIPAILSRSYTHCLHNNNNIWAGHVLCVTLPILLACGIGLNY